MRFIAFLALTALAASAQDSLQIVADDDTILVGRTLAMRAIVRDAQGNPRTGDTVAWSVNTPAIASISSTGELRPLTLGVVRVTARVGNLSSEVLIQTVPREVRMVPPTATLNVGATQQFRAEALNADGVPIPNVTWTWQANNRNGFDTAVITVSNSGLLTAKSDGGGLVRATYAYNERLTGLQRDWIAGAQVDVVTPAGYRITKVINNREALPTSFELRSRPSMLWGTEDGQLFFNANLDGVSNGLINWNFGAWKMVSAGGQPRFLSGSLATEFGNHSILQSGKILSREETSGNGTQLNRGDKNGLRPFLTLDAPMAGTEGTGDIFITRNSTSSSGWVLVRARFRFPGTTQTYQGLFRGFGDRITELLLWEGRAVEDFPRGFNIDADFGITDEGVAYYILSNGARRIVYRHQNERVKVIGTGDAILGSTVRSMAGGRERSPAFFVGEAGDFVLAVQLNNDIQYFLRYTPTTGPEPRSLRVDGQGGILWHHPMAGTMIFAQLPNESGANAAIIWPLDGPTRLVQRVNTAIFGQTVEEIESGTLTANGEATLMMRTSASSMMIARFGDAPRIIAQHGDRIPVTAPVNLFGFVGGGRLGAPHVLAGGDPSSIAMVEGNQLRPVAAIGDRLFGTTPWFGASSSVSNWNVRKSPVGDMFFTTDVGLVRVPVGTVEQRVFLRFPLTINNVQVSAPVWVDANSRGDVFWLAPTAANDRRLYITRNGTDHRQLLVISNTGTTATTLDGRVASDISSFALDDTGRLLTSIQFRNDGENTIYLWTGDVWQRLVRQNETRINNQIVRGISNVHRAAGSRLFSLMSIGDGGQVIAEWKGTAWEVIMTPSQILSHGQPVGNISLFEVNRSGDIFFQQASGTPFLMVRRGDRYIQVANLYRLVAGDEYILRVTAIDFRDDGTVYFLATTADDEAVLFMGRPL